MKRREYVAGLLSDDHKFCRQLLSDARRAAQRAKVQVPPMTALLVDSHQFLIKAHNLPGRYVSGCCSYEAKATLIHKLIGAEEES